jgi:hypothetical protein
MMSLAFDFVPKNVGYLRAPNNHTSLRIEALSILILKYVYSTVLYRTESNPTLVPVAANEKDSEESGRDSDYGESVSDI